LKFQIISYKFSLKFLFYYSVILNNKTIHIYNKQFTYSIRKSNRAKYVRVRINIDGGIELVVPRFVNLSTAEKFLLKKKEFLYKYFKLVNNRQNRYYYLGNEIEIISLDDVNLSVTGPILKGNKLFLYAQKALISFEDEYRRWLKERALEYIPVRAKELSEKHNLNYNRITIRDQKSRWGSCSSKNNLSFNYKLMYFNNEIIDYVIVHELCHLREMNHSKEFWKIVEGIMPDYKTYKQQLKSFFN